MPPCSYRAFNREIQARKCIRSREGRRSAYQATPIVWYLSAKDPLHGVRPFLAMCLSAKGEHQAARAELNEDVRRNAAVDPDIAYALASVYALEGDRDEAFEWLQRSVALGNENKPLFEHDPNLRALREDVRFGELIRRITRA